jgi:hypothetical protein
MSDDIDDKYAFEMGDDYADVDIGELAKNVYEYLRKSGGARIGELVEAFDVPYDLMARALERLRSEGKVVKFVEENYIATYRVWSTDAPLPETVYVNGKGRWFYQCHVRDAIVYIAGPEEHSCLMVYTTPECIRRARFANTERTYVYYYRRGDTEVYVVLAKEDPKRAWEVASKFLPQS